MVAKKKPTAKKAVSKAKKTAAPKKVSKKPVSKRADSSEDGPVYTQFKNKPVEAIRYLMKVQKGVAKDALYRKEIGYVDIAWGSNNSANKGHGLKHIIEKHGEEFKRLHFPIEYAIPFAIQTGKITAGNKKNRITFTTSEFVLSIDCKWRCKNQKFVITCYTVKKPRR